MQELLTDRPVSGNKPGVRKRLTHELPLWSEWRDLNPRPLDPQSSALPNCATPGKRTAPDSRRAGNFYTALPGNTRDRRHRAGAVYFRTSPAQRNGTVIFSAAPRDGKPAALYYAKPETFNDAKYIKPEYKNQCKMRPRGEAAAECCAAGMRESYAGKYSGFQREAPPVLQRNRPGKNALLGSIGGTSVFYP